MSVRFSEFATSIKAESAFTVLASAKRLITAGKDVVELEIGDSPFPTPAAAVQAGIKAIRDGLCHYGPSIGLPEFRQAAADYVCDQYGLDATADNIVAGPGGKNFETLFCEAFLDPGDSVLVFTPHFPTYPPNILRRGAKIFLSPLKQAHDFRPSLEDVERFLHDAPSPKAVFLNSPHNPTGGVALKSDLEDLANLIRGRNVAVFSDEPYDQMVWHGQHHSILAEPGMVEQCVGAYTFSKSFSMSGWRLGFAVGSRRTAELLGKLTNTSLSCVPPFTQVAGMAALRRGLRDRDRQMAEFRRKVTLLVRELQQIDGVKCLLPGGSFYAFPNVMKICNRLHITSHGLAMYLLEGADEEFGVACLGGECFGEAGAGYLRFSCAEPDERLQAAVAFFAEAIQKTDRVQRFLPTREAYQLAEPYSEDG